MTGLIVRWLALLLLAPTLAWAQGTTNSRTQDGTGNPIQSATGFPAGNERGLIVWPNLSHAADTNAISVRCVNAAGSAFESCAGTGGGGGGTSSNFTSAFPAAGTAAGFSDGVNMQGARVFNVNSSGTQYVLGVNLRLTGAGGSVELGGQTSPLGVRFTDGTNWVTPSAVDSANNMRVVGAVAHDAAAASVDPVLQGCYSSAAAPTGVSADGDAVRGWCLANGARAVQVTFGGALATAKTVGSERAMSVAIVDASGNQVTSFGGSGGTASNFTSVFPATGTAAGFQDPSGNMQGARVADCDTSAGFWYCLTVNLVKRTSGTPTELIGQATMANSLPVTLASDQSALTVSQATGTNLHMVCDSGCGAGTQYPQGGATTATDQLSMAGAVRHDTAVVDAGVADGDRVVMSTDNLGRLRTTSADTTQPVSGTVTANAGTNLNTSALALDATVGRAQGSTTSGQTGPLVQGAVTTAAPTYTTAQTSPLSLQTDGSVRTAVTNTVAVGTHAVTGSGNFTVVQSTGTNLHMVCDSGCSSSTAPADNSAFTAGTTSSSPISGFYHSTRDSVTDGRIAAIAINVNRATLVQLENSSKTELGTQTAPMGVRFTDGTNWITPTAVDGSNNSRMVGAVAQDAAASGVDPLLQGCYASAAAPTDVSADTDAVRAWCLRSGARAMQPTYAGVLASTGNGTAGTGTPRVTIASDNTPFTVTVQQSTGTNLHTVCDSGCGGAAADTVGSAVALNALNAAASVVLAGTQGASMFIAAGTLAATLAAEFSSDGGTTWQQASFYDQVSGHSTTLVFTNPNAAFQSAIIAPGGASHVRVRVSAFTSGSATATLRATTWQTTPARAITENGNLTTLGSVAVPATISLPYVFDGSAWRRVLQAANGTNIGGQGLPTAALMAQFDDASPTSITENNFGNLRMNQWRALHTVVCEGFSTSDRCAQVDSSGRLSVSVDNLLSNTPVVGATLHDSPLSGSSSAPIITGGWASAAAPTDVSADGDAVRAWHLRSGAYVSQPSYAGVLASTGNGVAGTGTPRVVIASDNTAFAVNAQPIAVTSGGATPNYYISAASNNSTSLKGSAGQVYSIAVVNTTTTLKYLRLYDTSSAPTCTSGTGVVFYLPIPPASASGQAGGFIVSTPVGKAFASGIGICLTGGAGVTDNTSTAAGDVVLSYDLK